jgi:hypothetical protein
MMAPGPIRPRSTPTIASTAAHDGGERDVAPDGALRVIYFYFEQDRQI